MSGLFRYLFCLLTVFLLSSMATTAYAQVKEPPSSAEDYEKRFKENIARDRINGVYIPKNLEDALAQLDKLIEPKAKASLTKVNEETAASRLHFSLGRWMMLNWQFYEGSRFSNYLHTAGVTFPDDKADLMIRAYHRHVNGKPIEFKELVKSYKNRRKAEHKKDLESAPVIKVERRKKN